jgi:hypothetical protein
MTPIKERLHQELSDAVVESSRGLIPKRGDGVCMVG